jgi:tRNA (guanosine-2'-O-)-methyltransferase
MLSQAVGPAGGRRVVASPPVTTPRRFHRLRAVLDRRQPDLTVLLEGVHKTHNLSAVLRTCDAVGVFALHAVTAAGVLPALNEAVTSGTGRWVGVSTYPDLPTALDELRGGGFQLVAAHPDPAAVDFRAVDYTRPTAVLLGQEKDGLSAAAAARADVLVAIPMLGMVASLNVSVAAALVLYEAQRQRAAAGLYERSRLEPETYRRTLFEWAYPDLAERCRRHGLPYPPVDEDGTLLGPVPR